MPAAPRKRTVGGGEVSSGLPTVQVTLFMEVHMRRFGDFIGYPTGSLLCFTNWLVSKKGFPPLGSQIWRHASQNAQLAEQ